MINQQKNLHVLIKIHNLQMKNVFVYTNIYILRVLQLPSSTFFTKKAYNEKLLITHCWHDAAYALRKPDMGADD